MNEKRYYLSVSESQINIMEALLGKMILDYAENNLMAETDEYKENFRNAVKLLNEIYKETEE